MENRQFKPPENVKAVHHHHHDIQEGVAEEIVYCEDDYDEEGSVLGQQDVPCYVMNNSFYSQISMETINRDHSKCAICGLNLTNRRFYNHLFDAHGFTRQQCEILKQQKKLEAFKSKQGRNGKKLVNVHACNACGMEYVTKSGLKNHLIKSPGCAIDTEVAESRGPVNMIVCPSYGCDKNVSTYMDLAMHVDTDHRQLTTVPDGFRIRRVTFPDKNSFLEWKRRMEKETHSEFFLRTSQKVTFAVRTILYKCLSSNSRGNPRGIRCEQCPAFIKVCERNHGQFEVVACFGHLGHEHPTETNMARDIRLEKYRQIALMEARKHDQLIHEQEARKQHAIVNHYNQSTDGMMLMMDDSGPVVEEEVEEDAYSNIVVDVIDDNDIQGPQESPSRREFVQQNQNPGPSHY